MANRRNRCCACEQIDLSPAAAGIYSVVFLNGEHKVVKKILVTRLHRRWGICMKVGLKKKDSPKHPGLSLFE